MITTDPRIDITRLEKVRRAGDKITARCPACAADGGDHTGNHFFLNAATGKFGCTVGRDAEHRRAIFALVGTKGERRPNPARDWRWRQERDEERRRASDKADLVEAAKATRNAIIARYPWEAADVWEDSPQRIDCPLVEHDPRHFIQSLFPQDARIWTGEVHHSGTRHADHWRTVAEWQDEPHVGPMVCPGTWKDGCVSRTADNVATAPYTVLDFDGLDGKRPSGVEAIDAHVRDSLALVRWLREKARWELAAVIFTGSVSIHAWFHQPPSAALSSLKATASALGIDPGLIGRPEHPCRLPGQHHAKTGNLSKVLWLQNPIA